MQHTVGNWAIDILCIALSPYILVLVYTKKSVAVDTLWIGYTWLDWERSRSIPSTHTTYDCTLRLINIHYLLDTLCATPQTDTSGRLSYDVGAVTTDPLADTTDGSSLVRGRDRVYQATALGY